MANERLAWRHRLASAILSGADSILEDWAELARTGQPNPGRANDESMMSSMRALLTDLAIALEGDHWRYEAAEPAAALRHALQRHQAAGYDSARIVDEYAFLRRAIFANPGVAERCDAGSAEMIHEFIDACLKEASRLYLAAQHQDESKALTQQRDAAQSAKGAAEGERDAFKRHADALEQERKKRSEVISMLGHDMQTPLTSALLSAQMLAKKPEDLAQAPLRLHRIIEGLERLSTMISNLLDADRLNAGQAHPINVSPGNMADVVSRSHQNLSDIFGPRLIAEIQNHVAGWWDCDALERVMENLVSNAVKYGAAEGEIALSLRQRGDVIEISVRNEGEPIAESRLPSLFEPRFRTDSAARSGQAGWGLGLAFVKAVAEAHGGLVIVDSAKGRGTTFCVRIPVDCRANKSAAQS